MKYFTKRKRNLIPTNFDYETFFTEYSEIQSELDNNAIYCKRITYEAAFRKAIFLFSGILLSVLSIFLYFEDFFVFIGTLGLGVLMIILVVIEWVIKKSPKHKLNRVDLRLVMLLNSQSVDANEKAATIAGQVAIGILTGTYVLGGFDQKLNLVYLEDGKPCHVKIRVANGGAKWAFRHGNYAIIALTSKKRPKIIRLVYKD